MTTENESGSGDALDTSDTSATARDRGKKPILEGFLEEAALCKHNCSIRTPKQLIKCVAALPVISLLFFALPLLIVAQRETQLAREYFIEETSTLAKPEQYKKSEEQATTIKPYEIGTKEIKQGEYKGLLIETLRDLARTYLFEEPPKSADSKQYEKEPPPILANSEQREESKEQATMIKPYKIGMIEIEQGEEKRAVVVTVIGMLLLNMIRSYFSMWFMDEAHWNVKKTVNDKWIKLRTTLDKVYRMTAMSILYIGAISFPRFDHFGIHMDFEYFILICYGMFVLWDIAAFFSGCIIPEIKYSLRLKEMICIWGCLDVLGFIGTAFYVGLNSSEVSWGVLITVYCIALFIDIVWMCRKRDSKIGHFYFDLLFNKRIIMEQDSRYFFRKKD